MRVVSVKGKAVKATKISDGIRTKDDRQKNEPASTAPTLWVCGHCTEEHTSRWVDKGRQWRGSADISSSYRWVRFLHVLGAWQAPQGRKHSDVNDSVVQAATPPPRVRRVFFGEQADEQLHEASRSQSPPVANGGTVKTTAERAAHPTFCRSLYLHLSRRGDQEARPH